MKCLKVFIICFSLFQLQVVQGTMAFAQDPTPTATPTTEQTNTGTGVVRGNFLEADMTAGTQTAEEETKNPSLASGHIFTAIQMIVIGLLAPTIITLCPSKASTYVFGAGALYYVAMELMNMGKFVKGSNEEMAIYKNVDVDVQMEALEAAASETENAAEAAHKKSDLSRNAAIVYGIAAIAALLEAIIESTPPATLFAQQCKGYVAINNNWKEKNLDIFKFDTKITQSSEFQIPYKNESSFISFRDKQLKQLPVEHNKTLLNKVFDMVLPEAKAGADPGVLSGLVGGVAAAIVVVFLIKDEMKELLQPFAKTGWFRFGTYVVFAGIATTGSVLIRSAAEDLDERAVQYRSLMSKLKQATQGGIQMSGGAQSINQGYASSSIKEADAAPEITTCFTGDKGQLKRDENCLCKKANNCKKSEVPTLNFQGFGGNGIINEPLSMFNDSANSLFGGDVSGAQASGAGIGNSAGKLGKLRRKIIDKFNNQRKAAGQAPINFNSLQGGFKSAFSKTIRKGLNSLSPAQAKALASMAPTKSSGMSKKKENIASIKVAGAKVAGTQKAGTRKNNMGFFLDDEEEGEISNGGINPDDLAGSMNGDNMFQGDITDRPDENIFKIITTRYLKSAYPKFFDENEEPAAK
jgi:hypothetical protein